MYKVEKSIPVANSKGRNGKTNFLRSLNVGDSFVITKNIRKTERSNWHTFAKRVGMKIVTRTSNEGEIRIWVIEKDGEKIDEKN